MGLVFKWIKRNGGVKGMAHRSLLKSEMIYKAIDDSKGFFVCPVDLDCRSRMNIPFRIGGPEGNADLESEFLKKLKKWECCN